MQCITHCANIHYTLAITDQEAEQEADQGAEQEAEQGGAHNLRRLERLEGQRWHGAPGPGPDWSDPGPGSHRAVRHPCQGGDPRADRALGQRQQFQGGPVQEVRQVQAAHRGPQEQRV